MYVIILHELTFNMEKYHNIALCLEQSGFINNYNKKYIKSLNTHSGRLITK